MMHSAEIITATAGWNSENVSDVQREMAVQLAMAGSETAMLDARLLMQHMLGCSAAELITLRDRRLTPRERGELSKLMERRKANEPMAYLTGERDFWDGTFAVNRDTLIPRPDSETLIEAVLEAMPNKQQSFKLLDLGTGTGCLPLSLLREYPMAYGTAADISEGALRMAEQNAERAEVVERMRFVKSDWFSAIEGRYQLIISNPPYIPSRDCDTLMADVKDYEPRGALDGGADGLHCYRTIAASVCDYLEKDGYFMCEIGQGQTQDVTALFKAAGLTHVTTRADLAGIERVLVFQNAKITS